MKYLFLLLLSMPSFADFKDWDKKNKHLWYSYITLSAIDTMQTYDMIQCNKKSNMCTVEETNPLFKKTPDIENVITTKILSAGVIFYFLDSQPESRKTRDLWIINGLQFSAVINNYEVGIRFKYVF
tara:strand:- start:51 stop:428 length:378 start_codon:yes stop_codon:yes gene_type:complete